MNTTTRARLARATTYSLSIRCAESALAFTLDISGSYEAQRGQLLPDGKFCSIADDGLFSGACMVRSIELASPLETRQEQAPAESALSSHHTDGEYKRN